MSDVHWTNAIPLLRRAKLILSAGFWGKNDYTLRNRRGRPYAYCAMGALHQATRLTQPDCWSSLRAATALKQTAWWNGGTDITNFNDRPDTTLEDVLNIYDEAIDLAHEKAANSL